MVAAGMSPFRASAPLTEEWRNFDFEVDEGVGTLTLNRPAKLNALTFDVYADLRDLVIELPHRGDTRVLIITGEGRGFSSGGDVEEIIAPLQEMTTAQVLEFTRLTGSVVKGLRECPVPVIAAVNGVAAGAGAVLALACDFRLMADTASFAFLFTRVGLAGADMGAAYLLPRLVGLGRATELLMLGEPVGAERACQIGLANEVVPVGQLTDRAGELADRLADGPAFAFATTKSLLTRELDMSLGAAVELESISQALMMQSADFEEFYRAWDEGRRPEWRGQ
jgi:enoyl-CoA hydratase/carnithine racemase